MLKETKDNRLILKGELERVMRFELTTSTLARLRSTPELHPRPSHNKAGKDITLCGGAFKPRLAIQCYHNNLPIR